MWSSGRRSSGTLISANLHSSHCRTSRQIPLNSLNVRPANRFFLRIPLAAPPTTETHTLTVPTDAAPYFALLSPTALPSSFHSGFNGTPR